MKDSVILILGNITHLCKPVQHKYKNCIRTHNNEPAKERKMGWRYLLSLKGEWTGCEKERAKELVKTLEETGTKINIYTPR